MNQIDTYYEIWEKYKNPKESVLRGISSLKKNNTNFDYLLTFAIVLPEEIQQKLFDLSETIKTSFPEHHYLPKEYYHLSLSYLTQYSKNDNPILIKEEIEKYKKFLEEKISIFPNILLKIRGLNHFDNCVFAQVWDDEGFLLSLNKQIQTEFQIKSKFSFVPHIAMIYYKQLPEKLFKYLENQLRDIQIGKFKVTEVSLLKWSLNRKDDYNAYEILDKKSL